MDPRKRAARILPDGPAFGYGVLSSVIAVFIAAFSISFTGQAEMARTYMGLTGPIRFAVPLVIDLSLLVYAASALVRRARGESVRWAVIATAFWTAISIGANMVHALQPSSILVTGALATLAPLAILMSSLTIESLLVAPPAVGAKLDREAALAGELEELRAEHARSIASAAKESISLRNRIGVLEGQIAKVADSAPAPPAVASKPYSAAKALASVPDLAVTEDGRDARILQLRASGMSQSEVAAAVGTSLSTVKRVLAAAKTEAA